VPEPVLVKFDASIAAIAQAMAAQRLNLIAHSSSDEYQWALHNLDVARQLAGYLQLVDRLPGTTMRYIGPVMQARDYAMAQNVRWVLENEGPQGRVLVYAHDGHVMNMRADGGIWAAIRQKPLMMGAYLRHMYGQDLFIMATSSATASVQLPPLKPARDSIDSALAQVGLPAMILDIRAARQNSDAFAWVSRPRPLQLNLATHVVIVPLAAVDAFFFVNRLTPGRSAPISGRLLSMLEHYWQFALAAFAALALLEVARRVRRAPSPAKPTAGAP
jgi:erythromycin esterase